MRYRKLGSSDLEVSEISLGSWLTFAGGVAFEQTRACTDAAFEAGINFFDTANVYGRGAAETAWGEILSGRPRDSYVLATKVWGQMSDDPSDRGLSAAQIAKQIDASLERLRTDYVDLYQAHRFDPDVPIEETIEASSRSSRPASRATWVQRVDARADPGGDRHRRPRPVRLLPAAVLDALAGARGRDLPALRGQRHLADRLVAARPGAAHRQVPARPGAAADSRAASSEMSVVDGPRHERCDLEAVDRLRPIAERGGPVDERARARLGAAPPRARLGDHRRLAPRAGPRQRAGRPASSSRRTRSRRSTRRSATCRSRSQTLAPFAQAGISHR